jgi:phosphatidylglycerophosphatase C
LENSFPTKTIAVFDFDHTLIIGDSFWAFLIAVAGVPRTALVVLEACVLYVFCKGASSDLRTFVKARLLRRLLAGKTLSQLAPAIEHVRRKQQWNQTMRQSLLDHHAQGHHIVIASGALDTYLHDLVQDLPHDAIICTQVDLATGAMTSGNCVRLRKAEMVKEYLAAHGPFAESWGYGNFPHDVPMLNLLKHRIIV